MTTNDNNVDLVEQLKLLSDPDEPLSKRKVTAFSNLDQQQMDALWATWRGLTTEQRQELCGH
ncbi:MAG: hypothetical protein HC876_06860 [Chloroflexaceae bacterium]|nr:hypothetical protein [Chloroflexaceae bacterium]